MAFLIKITLNKSLFWSAYEVCYQWGWILGWKSRQVKATAKGFHTDIEIIEKVVISAVWQSTADEYVSIEQQFCLKSKSQIYRRFHVPNQEINGYSSS